MINYAYCVLVPTYFHSDNHRPQQLPRALFLNDPPTQKLSLLLSVALDLTDIVSLKVDVSSRWFYESFMLFHPMQAATVFVKERT